MTENSKHRNITTEEFLELTKYVQENHNLKKGLKIKYIIPVYDTRTDGIFSITFKGMNSEANFSVTNENYERDLKEWVYAWLNEEQA